MSNATKCHDNTNVQSFLADYWTASELCRQWAHADDIFSGVLALKTSGNTATRGMSRKVLFKVLRECPRITTEAVQAISGNKYSNATAGRYAALARVASKALAPLALSMRGVAQPRTEKQEQEAIDRPHLAALEALSASRQRFTGKPLCLLVWTHEAFASNSRKSNRCRLEDLIS